MSVLTLPSTLPPSPLFLVHTDHCLACPAAQQHSRHLNGRWNCELSCSRVETVGQSVDSVTGLGFPRPPCTRLTSGHIPGVWEGVTSILVMMLTTLPPWVQK